MNGYIKLHRALLEDPLWNQVPCAWGRVALVCLMTANWRPRKWFDGKREVLIPAGSLITSRPAMCKLARVTAQQYRDAISYLCGVGFCNQQTTKRYTVVTITKWATYQGDTDDENLQRTTKEPTENPLRTTPEEGKNVRREEQTLRPPGESETEQPGAEPEPGFSEAVGFEAWDQFVAAVQDAGLPASSQDLALMKSTWRTLDFNQRLRAITGLKERVEAGQYGEGSETRFRPNALNYLRDRHWERAVRRRNGGMASVDEVAKLVEESLCQRSARNRRCN